MFLPLYCSRGQYVRFSYSVLCPHVLRIDWSGVALYKHFASCSDTDTLPFLSNIQINLWATHIASSPCKQPHNLFLLPLFRRCTRRVNFSLLLFYTKPPFPSPTFMVRFRHLSWYVYWRFSCRIRYRKTPYKRVRPLARYFGFHVSPSCSKSAPFLLY